MASEFLLSENTPTLFSNLSIIFRVAHSMQDSCKKIVNLTRDCGMYVYLVKMLMYECSSFKILSGNLVRRSILMQDSERVLKDNNHQLTRVCSPWFVNRLLQYSYAQLTAMKDKTTVIAIELA